MIRSLLPASIALHVVVLGVLPSAKPAAIAPRVVSVIEVGSEPPPPSPPPLPSAPAPTPASEAAPSPPHAARAPMARLAPGVTGNADAPAIAASPMPVPEGAIDGPADFTAAVLTNAMPGEPSSSAAKAAPSRPPGPAAPRFVPAASLARPPRAPGLDAELEKNYPEGARRAGIAGKAVLRVRILPDGRIAGIAHVSESYAGFADACARTVRAARWEPPIDAEGRPVATEITYVCRFEVRS